ncbi:hypothetical protein [Paracoccus sp. IB05]|uniref:hypothetical protein n=1 Tax=Paracoccus sp. IB05 TaxID=2779367 RepID=UPI0018E8A60C|nr:hypothetical protein [Paracoccus sp. IB05]MBJ2151365.1 hypothetical protein [Paracoccus sp. IB05]
MEDKVRELGIYCKLGKTKVMLPEHVAAFMEAITCRSQYSSGAASGITEAPSPVGNYADLQKRLTGKSPKGSRQKSKTPHGSATSTGRTRM